jgi:hypothetical protein
MPGAIRFKILGHPAAGIKPGGRNKTGGERGIRTLGEVTPTTVFETVAFNHSAISPRTATGYK